MFETHFTTVADFSAVFAVAGLRVFVVAVLGQDSAVRPSTISPSDIPTLDARSALPSAIALGFTAIRSAGHVGGPDLVEAVDTAGETVIGVPVKINAEM